MPLYEYECDACHHRFEVIQKFSDPPVETCPRCGGTVHKLIAAPAFQLKGSGWYITDYARKNSGDKGESGAKDKGTTPAEAKGGDTAKSDSSAGESKSETKTETKKETKTEKPSTTD